MTLRKAVEQYIAIKQSLGFRFHGERVILTAFSKAMGKVTLSQVKPTAVKTYLDGKGPVTRHWHRKWETLRPFYRFVISRGLVSQSPELLTQKKDIVLSRVYKKCFHNMYHIALRTASARDYSYDYDMIQRRYYKP